MQARDRSLDTLLDLDGLTLALDDRGDYWVQFEVRRVPATPEKPHGLDYALTMHGPDSGDPRDSRLVGFDNAHAVRGTAGPGGGAKGRAWDHSHRFRRIQPYDYADAATLLQDFWRMVEGVLKERGLVHE